MRKIFFTLIALFLLLGVEAQTTTPQAKGTVKVQIETKFGIMKILLYDATPLHRDNFIKLVNQGYYDSTSFHRVINTFMIQGGDPDSKNAAPGQRLGNGGPGYTIPAELNDSLIHRKGVLAAAREGDNVNPAKASSGSQFYIVQGTVYNTEALDRMVMKTGKPLTPKQLQAYTTVGGSPWLDGNYTIFGEVIEGMDVIDKIATVKTDNVNRPLEDIHMKISIIK